MSIQTNSQGLLKPGEEERISWTPWLLIRCTENDLGLRPVPPQIPFYLSPDIWVESSDPWGRPVAGEENFVHVRILNLGMAIAAPVKVDFYWGDPSLGLGPANMNLIGIEWVELISQGVNDVRCNVPWIPILVNQGHECLIVNCSNWILDPITVPFQATLDRHVGQRNVTVIEACNGERVTFKVNINNVFPIEARTTVIARVEGEIVITNGSDKLSDRDILNHIVSHDIVIPDSPSELINRLDPCTKEYKIAMQIARLASTMHDQKRNSNHYIREVSRNGRDAARISSIITDDSFIVKPNKPGQFFANLLLASDKMSTSLKYYEQRGDIPIEEIVLKPFEQRQLTLDIRMPDSSKENEYLSVHLIQIMEKFIVGGYYAVVKIVCNEVDKIKTQSLR